MSVVTEAALTGLKAVYDRDGWCEISYRFTEQAVTLLKERVTANSQERRPEVVYEKDSDTVRGIHGCHAFDDAFDALVRHPQLVALAEELTGRPVYVYQFKVNLKQAREGAAWPWHQDYAFWSEEDGMPGAHAVNIALSLDDIHEGNGPLVVLPGSHRLGLLDLPEKEQEGGSAWQQHVAVDLAYTVSEERAEKLAAEFGRVLITGKAGTVHAFHPSIVHSSSSNISPDRRALLLITYNAVDNAPENPTRPEFLVTRDSTRVTPVSDDRLGLELLPPA
ncbi:phytanoyl-CoA dioxygenase family protein [Streptomyces anulatus]|uniref:phytanoyl-CoA dioxygenase family protein n=1 Tax=Streptomyces anulatus TaxID=1892 RepID=UPI003419B99D